MHVLLGIMGLGLQICLAVHAARTGRHYWIFIIIFFPVVGPLVYFFAEVVPELNQSARIRKVRSGADSIVNPGKRLRFLEDQAHVTPSLQNKKALAEGYLRAGRFDEAVRLYESCLHGVHDGDSTIIEGLSLTYFFKGDLSKAKEHLQRLLATRQRRRNDEFDLLLARTLEGLGETQAALEEYRLLASSFAGEEARYRYGLLLQETGRTDEGKKVFEEILRNARISPKHYQKAQRKWIDLAKREL